MARREPNIRKLAARQRWVIWLVAASLLSHAVPFLSLNWMPSQEATELLFGLLGLFQLAVWIAMFVGAVLIMAADGTHPIIIVVTCVFLLAPCVNLLVLVLINSSATRTLKRAGVRVGFLGANPNDVERIVNPALCNGCGYNLTGNTSGVCTECGRAVHPRFCIACGYNLTGNTSGVCPECGQAVGPVVSAPPVA